MRSFLPLGSDHARRLIGLHEERKKERKKERSFNYTEALWLFISMKILSLKNWHCFAGGRQ
jgi:hypothetical protein